MTTKSFGSTGPAGQPVWVPLGSSLLFLVCHPRLLGTSLVLMLLTGLLTWLGYQLAVDFIAQFTGSFFSVPPTVERFWHWPLLWGWTALKWLFLILTRVIAFYLAFVVAYSLTTPGYVLLSTWAGNRFSEGAGEGEAGLTLAGALVDLVEGVKIGAVGLLVTALALPLAFIPVIGQAAVFTLYVVYSALMFLDFPASRYRWSLGQKLRWLDGHRWPAFRLGLLPALISMAPLLNVFLMALAFPLFTVHTTLHFLTLEGRRPVRPADGTT
jgi:CysZ protein